MAITDFTELCFALNIQIEVQCFIFISKPLSDVDLSAFQTTISYPRKHTNFFPLITLSANLARQLDRKDSISEIVLIYLTNLQQKAFRVASCS